MNAFTAFLESDWAAQVGLTLVHSLWQIALVALAYAMAALLLRNRSADTRYLLGCVTMVAMLGLPVGTYMALSHSPAHVSTAGVVMPSEPELRGPPSSLSRPGATMPNASHPVTPPAPAVFKTTAASVASDPAESARVDLLSSIRLRLPWATAVWLVGVLVLSLRPLVGWIHARRLHHHGLVPLPDNLQRAGERLLDRLGMKRVVRFSESVLVEVPTVVGYLRPIVLLPASAITGLSRAEIELILIHELAHIWRHDCLVNLAQTVIEALLFYHPGMWWVSGHIRKERENCCDDRAVAIGGDRAEYVHALARLEEQRSPTPVAGLAATGGALLQRARRLLGRPTNEFCYRTTAAWLAGLITIGFVAAALAMTSAYEGGYFAIRPSHVQEGGSGGLIKTEKSGTCAGGGNYLCSALQEKTGWPWSRSSTMMFFSGRPSKPPSPGHIFLAHFSRDEKLPDRAYEILVEKSGVMIQANHERGFEHAADRFVGLMERDGENWRIPAGIYLWDPKDDQPAGGKLSGVELRSKPVEGSLLSSEASSAKIKPTDTAGARDVVERWLTLIQKGARDEAARLTARGKNENADDVRSMALLLQAATQGNVAAKAAHVHPKAALVICEPLGGGRNAGQSFVFHMACNSHWGPEWRIYEVSLVGPEEIAAQLEAFHADPVNRPVDSRGFGPILERSLRRTSEHTMALDLDANRLIRVPNDFDTNREVTQDPIKWIVVRGIDVGPRANPNRDTELTGLGSIFFKMRQVENKLWDDADAAEVRKLLTTGEQGMGKELRASDGSYPVTYVFETIPQPTGTSRQGILQLLAVNQKEQTIELRYKLVGEELIGVSEEKPPAAAGLEAQ